MTNEIFFKNMKLHSNAKVQLLNNYLTVWIRKVTLGLKTKAAIFDTFAGKGIYDDGSVGSPIIILNAVLNYLEQNITHQDIIITFIELDKNNYKCLKENIEKLIGCKLNDDKINDVGVEHLKIGISNDSHESFISGLFDLKGIIPSLFFIDPFGFKSSNFENIIKLVKKGNCEFIYNFMYEYFNRFKENKAVKECLSNFYGSNIETINLEVKNLKPEDRRNYIIKKFKDNFKISGVKYLLDFDIQRDDKTSYVMTMIFATNNINGFDTMKKIMFDLTENISFEYHTKEKRLVRLFDYEKDFALHDMAIEVYDHFLGKTAHRIDIKNYCMVHDYIPSDYVPKILRILSNERKICVIDGDKEKYDLKKFPIDCIISFVK